MNKRLQDMRPQMSEIKVSTIKKISLCGRAMCYILLIAPILFIILLCILLVAM